MKEINKEIERTIIEVDLLLGILLQKASENWKNNTNDQQTKEETEKRLIHLFDKSQPVPQGKEKLSYSLYELRGMLTKVIEVGDKLPSLFNEKGEIDEKLLTLLTNVLSAFKELENEKGEGEEEQIIPTDGDFLKLLKKIKNGGADWESDSDDEKWLENELKKEKLKNAKLRKELVSLKAAEKDKENQLRQQKEKEKRTGNEIKKKLESIDYSTAFPSRITTEQLTNFLTRLREMEDWLITGTDEQQKGIREEYSGLKKLLGRLELEEKRRDTEQAIADALADKDETVSERQVKIKREKLLKPEHRDYSSTLNKKKSLGEIIKFEREILSAIAEQRNEYETIKEALSWGEEAIENKNINQAIEARKYLVTYHELQLKQKKVSVDYDILLNKMGKFHALIGKLNSFIRKEQQERSQLTSQTVQPPK